MFRDISADVSRAGMPKMNVSLFAKAAVNGETSFHALFTVHPPTSCDDTAQGLLPTKFVPGLFFDVVGSNRFIKHLVSSTIIRQCRLCQLAGVMSDKPNEAERLCSYGRHSARCAQWCFLCLCIPL